MAEDNNKGSKAAYSQQQLTDTLEKPPKWLTVFSVVALLWNLMGVFAFISQVTMTSEVLGKMAEAEQALYINMPFWANAAFAVAVFSALTASFMLLCKMSWAVYLFSASLLGVIVQLFHAFVISAAFTVFGPQGLIMPVMVITFAIACLLVAIKSKRNGWLN